MNRRDHRVKVDHHVNRRSDLRDDDHRLPLDDRHRMGCLGVDDLKMDVNSDVSRGHHMNDLLGGHLMGASRVNRNCVRRDLNLVVKMDVSRGLRMSDLLVGHLMDGSHVNRNYAPRDLMTDVNLGAMNHHVMLMDDRSKSCDRMSHVHLRYDRQMKRRRDMNRMDGMNLDGKMKIRRVSWC